MNAGVGRQTRSNDRRGLDFQPVMGRRGVGFSLGSMRELVAPWMRAVARIACATRGQSRKGGRVTGPLWHVGRDPGSARWFAWR